MREKVCVCVCERERERERDKMFEIERDWSEKVCKRERKCLCVVCVRLYVCF